MRIVIDVPHEYITLSIVDRESLRKKAEDSITIGIKEVQECHAAMTKHVSNHVISDKIHQDPSIEEEKEKAHREVIEAQREALLRIKGLWKDRTDLPDFDEIRKNSNRFDYISYEHVD